MRREKVSLRDYVDTRFADIERLTVIEKENVNLRLEGLNGFQNQFNDIATRLPTREEVEDKIHSVSLAEETSARRVETLEAKIANLEGRLWALGAALTVFATVISAAISFAIHFIP